MRQPVALPPPPHLRLLLSSPRPQQLPHHPPRSLRLSQQRLAQQRQPQLL